MFILLMGVTGSGKTTVGERLSVALGWPFFDADDYHSPPSIRKMSSGVPLTDEDREPWLNTLRSVIAGHEAKGLNGILACSALKESYRRILSSAADVMVVYLKAHPELIRARLADRPDHFMPQHLIESQFLDLEEPDGAITIPADWPTDRVVIAIQSQLGSRGTGDFAHHEGAT
jgi:carbohydrate kinase (thermoresistant glucokinase family)